MSYNKTAVKNEFDALVYMVECTLATVGYMASLKNKSKHEYNRQMSIAQDGINWIIQFNISVNPNGRVYDILSSEKRNVTDWAKKYETI